MRFLSLFSGIEAASEAWVPLGWECAAVAEIEPFPNRVLAHRHPGVRNLGDVTKITEQDIASLGDLDLIIFGSPCQDLSIAGKRKGLEGARSGLFFTAIDIIRWARFWCGARFALWENVPGAFSSNKGRDFAAVVDALSGLDGTPVPPKRWGTEGAAVGPEAMVEWAVLDAQWFGVAQRRRRVFALADFGNWAGREPILLEPESLRGDSAPRREAGEEAARSVAPCLTSSGRGVERAGGTRGQDPIVAGPGGAVRRVAGCWWDGGQVSQTLDAVLHKGQTMPEKNRFPAVLIPPEGAVAYGFQASQSGIRMNNTVGTLDANYGSRRHNGVIAFPANLSATQYASAADLSPSLCATNPTAVATPWQVRRLTPRECERLQGFTDDHTLVPVGKKLAADGPRYKALGNSMAVPVIRWIGRRIELAVLFGE